MGEVIMYFDTHAHYSDERFNKDRDELLGSMNDAGITFILNAGCCLESSGFGLTLADKYPFIYASVGVHPHDTKGITDETVCDLEQMLSHPKAVAVGEIGLDYLYDYSPRDVQKKWFREQLELSRRIKKPVIVHMREATADTMDLIRDYRDVSGVFHCFPGSWETAKVLLDLGWFLSYTGVITFKNARKAPEVIGKMPRDRLMLETDCPYMAPEPMRGQRNSSLFLPYIAEKVADIWGVSTEEVAEITAKNGMRCFRII